MQNQPERIHLVRAKIKLAKISMYRRWSILISAKIHFLICSGPFREIFQTQMYSIYQLWMTVLSLDEGMMIAIYQERQKLCQNMSKGRIHVGLCLLAVTFKSSTIFIFNPKYASRINLIYSREVNFWTIYEAW